MASKKFLFKDWISLSISLNPLRSEIRKLEDEIDRVTNGEFKGKYNRGLSTYRIREFERIWNKYPQARDLLLADAEKHRELYERLYNVSITDPSLRRDESVQNILKILIKFGRKFSLAEFCEQH